MVLAGVRGNPADKLSGFGGNEDAEQKSSDIG
jgi:hypothetical protein